MLTPRSVRFDHGADQEAFQNHLTSALRTSDGASTPNRVKFVEEIEAIDETRAKENQADEGADKGDTEVQNIEVEMREEHEQPVAPQTVKTVRFPDAQ